MKPPMFGSTTKGRSPFTARHLPDWLCYAVTYSSSQWVLAGAPVYQEESYA
jgi:hypothetical protein